MAPTPLPTLVHSSNAPSGRHHHLRRQALGISHHSPGESSTSGTEEFEPRTPDLTLQPSIVPEGPSPPPFAPAPTELVAQGPHQPGDAPGNIVAAVVLTVLVLSGLIGLFVGGAMLRRQAKATGKKRGSPPPSRGAGRRKSKSIKNATGSPQQRIKMHENSPYNEKTLSPLSQPPPVVHKERQRRLTDVWPIRSLSRALCNRRPCPEQGRRSRQPSTLIASPQTTWSEFTPVSLYVAPPRTVLARIPEEHEEDCQSQTSGGISVDTLGVTHRRLLGADSIVLTPETKPGELSHDTLPEVTTEQSDPQDFQATYAAETREEDAKSLGSSAPDMTSDGGESSRSSIVSLESVEGGNDGESLREGVFELRRAQTKSMQMNKGVLLSLSLKTLPDHGPTHGCGPSRPSSTFNVAAEGKEHDIERELSLAMLDGSYSAVNLDEFPSPPLTLLPVIPSFVSGF